MSRLTRDEISKAATYLQIYPVIDLLKETAPDKDFAATFGDCTKNIEDLGDHSNDYDSENTIVDDTELIAAFNTMNEESPEAKDRQKHPRKQSVTARFRKSRDSGDLHFTTIKQENLDDDYERVKKNNLDVRLNKDPDFDIESEKTKSVKKSQNTAKEKRKSQPTNLEKTEKLQPLKVYPKSLPKIELRITRSRSSKLSLSKEKSKSKKKSKSKPRVQKPVKKIKIKKEKIKEQEMKKTVIKPHKIYKPYKKGKCVCTHCKRKFPAYVVLRKHLLVFHKQKFVDEWEFSRYLIKYYSGSSKYIESCSVDISGHKNIYKCSKCKKSFDKYSLHCLHFKRHHMMKRIKLHGQFFIISKKLKRLENLLQGIIQKSNLKIKTESQVKGKSAGSFQDRPKKLKTAECSICNKMFVNELTLKVHQRKMHGIEPKRKYRVGVAAEKKARESTKLFQCADCEKYMVSQYALQKHLKVRPIQNT